MSDEPNWKQMAKDMIHFAQMYHPLPWHIEEDWSSEVTDAKGHIVCKTSTHFAQQIIDEANRHDHEMKEFNAQFELEMAQADVEEAAEKLKKLKKPKKVKK